MTSKKKHGHKEVRDNQNRNLGNVYRGRLTPLSEKSLYWQGVAIHDRENSDAPKSETIHANGKTRPIRDEKGHFLGSESISPTELKIPVSKRGSFKVIPENKTPQKGSLFLNYNIDNAKRETKQDVPQLKIYRIYAENEIGYRYEISQNPPANKTHVEVAMVLYDPRIDIIALDRAITNYRVYPE